MAGNPDEDRAGSQRISLLEPHEVRSWTAALEVDGRTISTRTKKEKWLRVAVAAVDDSSEGVREYLSKK